MFKASEGDSRYQPKLQNPPPKKKRKNAASQASNRCVPSRSGGSLGDSTCKDAFRSRGPDFPWPIGPARRRDPLVLRVGEGRKPIRNKDKDSDGPVAFQGEKKHRRPFLVDFKGIGALPK